jgi:hypothetical protein
MGFFKSLARLFGPTEYVKPIYRFTARCNRCGEVLQGRVDLHNDISLDDDGSGFHCTKVLIGKGENLCFNKVEVNLTFDSKRQLKNREISGGTFEED